MPRHRNLNLKKFIDLLTALTAYASQIARGRFGLDCHAATF